MGGGGKEGGPRVTRVGSSCDGQEEAEHLIYFQTDQHSTHSSPFSEPS